MIVVRFSCAAAFAAVALLLSGCGGSSGGMAPGSLPKPEPVPAASKTATLSLASTGMPQALPSISGISSSIVVPANNAAPNSTLSVTLSTNAPTGLGSIPANSAQALLYFTMQPSSDATFGESPKIAMTMPSAPHSQGAFYAWLYDVSAKTWTLFATVSVSGNQVTFGGSTDKISMTAGRQYVLIPFTAAPYASCPTPGPTPTPSPTPTPTPPPPAISGKWYLTATDSNNSNAALNTYDEETGKQLASLSLNYPSAVMPNSMIISKDASKLYIAGYGPLVNGEPSTFPLPGLTIVNTATNTIAHQTTIDGGVFTGVLSADGTRYYAGGEDANGNELFIFDASTGALLNTISVPQFIGQLLANPNGSSIYFVAGQGVQALNTTTNAITTISSQNGNLAINAAGTKLYLVNNAPGSPILILNASTGAQIGSIAVPSDIYSWSLVNPQAGSPEARDDSSFLVGFQYNSYAQRWGYADISTTTDSIAGRFEVSVLADYALNGNGSFFVDYLGGELPAYPNIDARALPLGQLYYTDMLPSGIEPFSAAAQ